MGGPIHPNPQCGHCVHFPTMFKIASLKLNGQDLVSAEWKRGLEGQLGQCGERQDASCLLWCPVSPVLPLQVRAKLKRLDIFLHQSPSVYLKKSNTTLYIYQKRPISSLRSLWSGHFDQGKPHLKNPGSIGQITPPRTAAHRVHCATVQRLSDHLKQCFVFNNMGSIYATLGTSR